MTDQPDKPIDFRAAAKESRRAKTKRRRARQNAWGIWPFVRAFPEMEIVADDAVRGGIYEDLNKQTIWDWKHTLYYAALVVMLYPTKIIVDWHLLRWWVPAIPADLISTVAWLVLAMIVATFLVASRFRRKARKMLWERGYPICRKCGYDLAHLTEPRCSECGTEFDRAEVAEALARRKEVT